MTTDKRLIEVEFLLEQVSIETVRQGASLDAAYLADALAECPLIAMPLPDHEGAEEHEVINRHMAGPVVETVPLERRNGCAVEKRRRQMRSGVLHWMGTQARSGVVPHEDSRCLRRSGAQGAQPVRGQRCHSVRGHASRLWGHGKRPETRRPVHSEVRA